MMTSELDWLSQEYATVNPTCKNKVISFNYDNLLCRVTLPSDSTQYHIVEIETESECSWLDMLNLYCIEKTPSFQNIIKKLIRYIRKEKPLPIVLASQITNPVEKSMEPLVTYNFDADNVYKLKNNLQKLIGTSRSAFEADGSSKQIFDQNAVANIIIDEYIETKNLANSTTEQSCGLALECNPRATKLFELELLDNNIYSWVINFSSFQNESINASLSRVMTKYGYNHIQVELHFHNVYYPMYPPMIKIIKPRLDDSLMHRIANSKMVQTDYWTPTRNAKYIIQRIKYILEKYGSIAENGDVSITKIESYLLKLASFVDTGKDDEIDSDEQFIRHNINATQSTKNTKKNISKYDDMDDTDDKVLTKKSKKNSPSNNSGWKAGTGYGTSHDHKNSKNWDPSEYIKIQEEKDRQISSIITNIIVEIQSSNADNLQIFRAIEHSLLIPYIKQQLKGTNLLDMSKRSKLYKLYFNLLENLATDKSIYLFNIRIANEQENLYDILKSMKDSANIAAKVDIENEFANMIVFLHEGFIEPLYRTYCDKQIILAKPMKIEDRQHNIKEKYVMEMKQYNFGIAEIYSTNFRQEYKKSYGLEKGLNWDTCIKRLSGEIASLAKKGELPIHYDSSIFLRVDESKPMIIRVLITGPDNTPYDSGCFIFDIYIPSKYPNKSPEVWFMTHGGNRFNPNLYNSGKVCLSILGTYAGPATTASENWNASTSTLLQILVSIQAQILIDVPYFNEPGYESENGTERGKKQSDLYNEAIRYFTMKSTVCDLLEHPESYPQFTDVILNHFKLKKDYILMTYKKWCDEAVTYKARCTELYNKIKNLIN